MIERERHTYTTRAVCPWCGHAHEGSWEWEQGPHDCHECGKPFDVDREVEVFYTTAAILPCGTCGRAVPLDRKGRLRLHDALKDGESVPCLGSRLTPAESGAPAF